MAALAEEGLVVNLGSRLGAGRGGKREAGPRNRCSQRGHYVPDPVLDSPDGEILINGPRAWQAVGCRELLMQSQTYSLLLNYVSNAGMHYRKKKIDSSYIALTVYKA